MGFEAVEDDLEAELEALVGCREVVGVPHCFAAGAQPRELHRDFLGLRDGVPNQLLRNLVTNQGVTILLTTQYLEEADQLADQIAVLDGGRLVAEGTAEELKRRVPGGHILLRFATTTTTTTTLDAAAHALGQAVTSNDEELTLQVPSDGSARSVQAVLNKLDSQSVTELSLHTPDLDDVFLALTGTTPTDKKA